VKFSFFINKGLCFKKLKLNLNENKCILLQMFKASNLERSKPFKFLFSNVLYWNFISSEVYSTGQNKPLCFWVRTKSELGLNQNENKMKSIQECYNGKTVNTAFFWFLTYTGSYLFSYWFRPSSDLVLTQKQRGLFWPVLLTSLEIKFQ
jgi:hypothetical protein